MLDLSGRCFPFINRSPIDAKLTSFFYVHASCIFVSPPTFTVTIVTIGTATCVSAILPINRQISPFLFYFSLRGISKYLVKIMLFNNRKLNLVRLYGKYVNLSEIGPS